MAVGRGRLDDVVVGSPQGDGILLHVFFESAVVWYAPIFECGASESNGRIKQFLHLHISSGLSGDPQASRMKSSCKTHCWCHRADIPLSPMEIEYSVIAT
jgi:hypothetical protein